MKKISASVALLVLLFAFGSAGLVSRYIQTVSVDAQSTDSIDTSTEFSNGTIGSPSNSVVVWYVWVNTSGVQMIYLACLSYIYPSPTITFFGEHYTTQDGTEMFVGNTLTAMEVYNDTNGNGLPDAGTDGGQNELLYNYCINSSLSFQTTPLQKTEIGGVYHYKWGLRYDTVDGFLLTGNESTAARVILDHIGSSFDFYVQDNVSYLKTSLDMGKILTVTPVFGFEPTLDGLSLSLLYGTTIDASSSYTPVVNGEPFNSTTSQNSTVPIQSGEIKVNQTRAYEAVFGQNYTLFNDSQQIVCSSKSAAVSDGSVFGGLQKSVEFALSFLEQLLTNAVQPTNNLPININLDYNASSLLYRVCYPEWGGNAIQHDPTYIAYLAPTIVPEINISSPPVGFIVVVAVFGSIMLLAALLDIRKTRKIPTRSLFTNA